MTPRTAPSTSAPRLLAPDLSRGVMLLLIAMAYAGVYVGVGFGTDVSHEPVLDRVAAFLTTLLLDNRAFPMFAILFGYGLAWSTSRLADRAADPGEIRRRIRRRGWFLLLFGAVHALLIFPGEILTSYGLATLLTGWLLFRSDRALLISSVLLGVFYVLSVPLMMVGMALGSEDESQASVPGYLTVHDWLERLFGLPIAPLYIALAYPLLLLVVLGYRAGRARLLDDPESHRSVLLAIALGGVGVSVLGALPSALTAIGAFSPDPVASGLLMGLQVLTGVAGGAGYAAVFTLWSIRLDRSRGPLTTAVAAVGQRSLTFYIFNSALIAIILHPDLIGLGTRVGGFGALVTAALTWTASLGLASWLARKGLPGPLDQLLRRCVHGRAG